MVSCHVGEPHQIATGTPLDSSHNCLYKSLGDIILPCLVSPEHTLRSYVCWSCTVCHHTYRGTTAACSKESCRTNTLATYNGVAKRFTTIISGSASLSARMWSQVGTEYPEVLSPTKLCEMLLSPHGNRLSGMQHGAWTLLEDEGKCSCVPAVHPSTSPPSTTPSPVPAPPVPAPPVPTPPVPSPAPPELLSCRSNSSPTLRVYLAILVTFPSPKKNQLFLPKTDRVERYLILKVLIQ